MQGTHRRDDSVRGSLQPPQTELESLIDWRKFRQCRGQLNQTLSIQNYKSSMH